MNENNLNVILLFFLFLILVNIYIYKKILKKYKREYQPIINKKYDPILYDLPLRQFLENRDRSVLNDQLVAPERRVDINQYPNTIKNLINIPTRGYPDNYQLIGILSRESDEKILQLFGRATFPGSNQYEYYITTEQYGFTNKIPIETKGKKEIVDNDIIDIPIFDKSKGSFKVQLYNYNTPRYNPYIY